MFAIAKVTSRYAPVLCHLLIRRVCTLIMCVVSSTFVYLFSSLKHALSWTDCCYAMLNTFCVDLLCWSCLCCYCHAESVFTVRIRRGSETAAAVTSASAPNSRYQWLSKHESLMNRLLYQRKLIVLMFLKYKCPLHQTRGANIRCICSGLFPRFFKRE